MVLTAEGAYYGDDKDGKPIERVTENFQNPTNRLPAFVELGVREALGRVPASTATSAPAIEDTAGVADVEIG